VINMIIQEILPENTDLIKTYSDAGKFVVNQHGDAYAEAIDLKAFIDNGTIVYVEGDDIPVEEAEVE